MKGWWYVQGATDDGNGAVFVAYADSMNEAFLQAHNKGMRGGLIACRLDKTRPVQKGWLQLPTLGSRFADR